MSKMGSFKWTFENPSCSRLLWMPMNNRNVWLPTDICEVFLRLNRVCSKPTSLIFFVNTALDPKVHLNTPIFQFQSPITTFITFICLLDFHFIFMTKFFSVGNLGKLMIPKICKLKWIGKLKRDIKVSFMALCVAIWLFNIDWLI